MKKILAIGNSFSQDATAYLYELALAAGEELKIVNLYIGGCPLSRHAFNALGRERDYKLEYNGFLTNFDVSIYDALKNEPWDVITLQQASHLSFRYETYQPYLETLRDYIHTYAPTAELMVHQTWAYEEGSERLAAFGFETAAAMFADVRAAYAKAAAFLHARLLPSGDAIRRAAELDLVRMYRDGYHLSFGAGRYTAACVWLETILSISAAGNPFDATTEPLTRELRAALADCAHAAVAATL
ncbi:MAG: DUF4886 domain-containing protein [Clostridiaceae bacterium]|nr:DUF4886 domain-containing protein [Clostridiaceae bacterium]